MSPRTIDELERELHLDDHDRLGSPDLVAIRAAGMQRRHLTALGTGVGVLASMVAVGLLLSGTLGSGGRAVDAPPPATQPHELSDLAHRALAEIAGSRQVSDWQVVVPTPVGGPSVGFRGNPVQVTGTPVDTGGRHYLGVTAFDRTDFPLWLYNGVAGIEQSELGTPNEHPVGSLDTGILVDDGPAYLGCASGEGSDGSASCWPALLSKDARGWHYEWGMGTDDFLRPGSDMEVFLSDDYGFGEPGEIVLAGLPGTDVARVDLVKTDGSTVAGHVGRGTIVPGASMMWGTVVGEVAAVIAYDVDGNVIEDHELKPCSGGVDCEVR